MREVRVQRGRDLITQGDTGNAFYIVEEGKFTIHVNGKQAAPRV